MGDDHDLSEFSLNWTDKTWISYINRYNLIAIKGKTSQNYVKWNYTAKIYPLKARVR